MDWLSQNWIYILLVLAVVFLMRRGGFGCGQGRGRRDSPREAPPAQDMTFESAVDPVSGQTVDPRNSIATLYRGQAYFFGTAENRERFEAAPERYVARARDGHETRGEQRHGC